MTPEALAELFELRDQAARIPFCPHTPSPKQREFLRITAREALYGGAAGGGKSDALLMAALQYIHVSGYNALILRRTFADLNKPEALMDRARDWFSPYIETHGVRWNDRDKRWTFPTPDGGVATIGFGYLDHVNDVEQYQGAAYAFVAFDEATHFVERQYVYLLSRQRRLVGVDVPIRTRAATNPGGVGHKWVMARFGLLESGAQRASWEEKREGLPPRTITREQRPFVPALMGDNQHLDQDAYNQQLDEQDATTQAQLRDGKWIQDGKKRIFHYRAGYNVPALPFVPSDPRGQMWERVFIVDLGASVQDRTTSFTRLAFHPHIHNDVFVEFSRKTAGEDPWTIEAAVTREVDACVGVTVVMDEGALGKGYGNGIRSRHDVPLVPAEKSDKRGYTRLLRGAVERGHIHCLEGACDDLIDEMDALIYDKNGMDAEPGLANHCCDGLLYGWRWTYAHRSQAPAPTPVPGSVEWQNAEAERLFDEEYARAARQREDDPWSSLGD